jgi:hypothetical protein
MGAKKGVLKGKAKPIGKDELAKLKRAIDLSRKQTKEDSKIDLGLLKADFNI